jgi:integrase
MSQRLTDAIVKRLPTPPDGNKIHYDADVGGFGCRVTAAGSRAYVLTYRTRAGRQRRYTIGSATDWQATAARDEARRLKQVVDQGGDPLAELEHERGAATVADLCARFEAEHLPRKRASTQSDYRRSIRLYIRPTLGGLKVADVAWSDVDALHRKITKAGHPYQANRTLAALSKMFALAIRWHMRPDNPCKGVERNVEHKRKRYLSGDELARLTEVLGAYDDRQAVDIIRLLLLTGCRRGEALAARWADLDLTAGTWTKPGSTTKQRTDHVTPLFAPARQLLAEIHHRTNSEWVFPAESVTGHRVTIQQDWVAICKAAKITGLRVHDLRHSFASLCASGGASLPLIGALLGHSSPATTSRYAHLFDDPQRAAIERVGAVMAAAGMPRAVRHG